MVSALSCYVAGVTASAIEYITEAVNATFGECNIEEVGRDSLRYKVRTASRDSSVVFVVLDTASMEECKDIENGLYSSSKFYNFTTMRGLVDHLNDFYGLNLVYVEEDMSTTNEDTFVSNMDLVDDREELREKYESLISDRDAIISNLGAQIKELRSIISDSGLSVSKDTSKVSSLEEEIIKLKGIIADKDSEIDSLNATIADRDKNISSGNDEVDTLKSRVTALETEKLGISQDLADERVLSSKKTAVIKNLEQETKAQQSEIKDLRVRADAADSYRGQILELDGTIKDLRSMVSNLNIELQSKNSDISRLQVLADTKAESDAKVEELTGLLKEANSSLEKARKSLSEVEDRYAGVLADYSDVSARYDSEKSRADDLDGKYRSSEMYLAKANEACVQLREEIRVLKSSVSVDEGMQTVMAELSDMRRKYSDVMSNVFNVISSKSLPRSNVKVPLLFPDQRYSNLRFVFSGSTESRKGTYKCLYRELANSKDRYLIVDVTSETAIDYVFQMKGIVDGLDWYSSGGSVQRYISSTSLSNVKVLTPKIGYVNDSFFLTINWEKRLSELENSGYKVILYCGDISTLVSRVLFESFVEVASTYVYVHGNVLGSRSLVANSGGLQGIAKCTVRYYEYDKNVAKFYEWMSKKCSCEIISQVGA